MGIAKQFRQLERLAIGALSLSMGCTPAGGTPAAATPAQPEAATDLEPLAPDANIFQQAPLFVDPDSQAAHQARRAHGEEAHLLELIARQPQADWLGDWTAYVDTAARLRVEAAQEKGAIRVMVAYNIPNRDCGQYSKGGVQDSAAYREWIGKLASGLGGGRAAIILEPDALGLLKDCLSDADQAERLKLIRDAVRTLREKPATAVYIDAGNANWIEPAEMAKRLESAGVHEANGFALNVSNYVATDKTIAYGLQISEALGGVGFVIDTSRNGRGEADGKEWCNPDGRGLGSAPTADTADPHVHAYLWVKRPGESDGECNGGPKAGAWYGAKALELARNASL